MRKQKKLRVPQLEKIGEDNNKKWQKIRESNKLLL